MRIPPSLWVGYRMKPQRSAFVGRWSNMEPSNKWKLSLTLRAKAADMLLSNLKRYFWTLRCLWAAYFSCLCSSASMFCLCSSASMYALLIAWLGGCDDASVPQSRWNENWWSPYCGGCRERKVCDYYYFYPYSSFICLWIMCRTVRDWKPRRLGGGLGGMYRLID